MFGIYGLAARDVLQFVDCNWRVLAPCTTLMVIGSIQRIRIDRNFCVVVVLRNIMTIGKKCGPTTTAGDCSMRVMCKDCPFNPQSVTFSYRDDWVKELENVQFEKQTDMPQGCHMLPQGQVKGNPLQADQNFQCVGHIEYMKARR